MDRFGPIHFPPPYNPEYERERENVSLAALEYRMEELADDANRLAAQALAAYDAGDHRRAEELFEASDRCWAKYRDLRQQLNELEAGW